MCIVATSTYGSELSPEVQFLRNFRDDTVLTTFAGNNFMEVFNAFYYSWSPSVAFTISVNEELRATMKIVLYPLIGILHLSSITYSVLSFNPEIGVIAAGLVASSLIAIIYLLPVVLLVSLIKKIKVSLKVLQIAGVIWLTTIIALFISEITSNALLMRLSSGTFVITTMVITILASLKMVHQYSEIKSSS
jgi:peptide/nickel transport system substrate-binding protein